MQLIPWLNISQMLYSKNEKNIVRVETIQGFKFTTILQNAPKLCNNQLFDQNVQLASWYSDIKQNQMSS